MQVKMGSSGALGEVHQEPSNRPDSEPREPSGLPPTGPEMAWPETGRLAGVDYGTVRIGVSLCDPSRTWISPLETFQRRAEPQEALHFRKLANDNQILGWVVGLPIHCDGRDSSKAKEAREFARWLSETTARPVRFVDERYSSALATRLLRELNLTHAQRKKHLDKVAAHIILEAYLESSKHPGYRPITLENQNHEDGTMDALDD
ncbi:MAG: Holliday junction resolvase RuvX [Pirellula sp.]